MGEILASGTIFILEILAHPENIGKILIVSCFVFPASPTSYYDIKYNSFVPAASSSSSDLNTGRFFIFLFKLTLCNSLLCMSGENC